MGGKRFLLVLAVVVVVIATLVAWTHVLTRVVGQLPTEQAEQAPAPRRCGPITIDETTTFITKPFRSDGYVDYIAALNESASAGVTPENNSAVLFCRAFGPPDATAVAPDQFFSMLGISPPPNQGAYLQTGHSYIQSLTERRRKTVRSQDLLRFRSKLCEDVGEIRQRPWSDADFPEMAEWLRINREPLSMVVAGTRRSRYYMPLLSRSENALPGMVLNISHPMMEQTQDSARLLVARAMFRLQQGDTDSAWSDLLACHRLARLVGQDPTATGASVSLAIDEIACAGDACFIRHSKLQGGQALRMLAQLQRLVPLPSMSEKINSAERYTYLDSVCAIARGDGEVFQTRSGRTDVVKSMAFKLVGNRIFDWDLVLRNGNSCYDRMVDALRKPTFAERTEAVGDLESELKDALTHHPGQGKLASFFFRSWAPRRSLSRYMGNVMVSLMLPTVKAARMAEDRATTRSRLNEIAFALAAYHADRGRYPIHLDRLSPTYIAQLPVDPFTDRSFRYKRKGDNYLIYSLGPSGVDDEGKLHSLRREDETVDENMSDTYDFYSWPEAG